MKLKDFKILNIFSSLDIFDKNNNKIATIVNGFEYGDNIRNFKNIIGDDRTELEKWNLYKDCEILEIRNADMDLNWENNYVEIVLNI